MYVLIMNTHTHSHTHTHTHTTFIFYHIYIFHYGSGILNDLPLPVSSAGFKFCIVTPCISPFSLLREVHGASLSS